MTDETLKPDNPDNDSSASKQEITARANLFWIALLVGLTIAAIYFLVDNAGKSWTGTLLFCLALMLFWSMEDDGGAPEIWVGIIKRLATASEWVLIVLAMACSVAAAWIGHYLEGQSNPVLEDIAAPLWVTAGAIILLMHAPVSWQAIREWWRDHRLEIVVVALMTLGAAVLRFYQLETIPNIITAEGGRAGMAALKLIPADNFYYTNPFSFFEGFGRPYLNTIAIAIDLFGRNKFGLRFIPALGGVLAIPTTYIFARRLLGVRNATIAALLLMVSHAHIHFSRTSPVGYQQATWLAPLELYCLLRGLEERKRAWIVAAGLLLGLHFNTYLSAQVLIPMVFVFLGMAAIISPPQIAPNQETTPHAELPLRENLRNLPWFLGSILLLALPSLVWIYYHPASFGARWAKDGLFQSGWLTQEMTSTGQHPLIILLERLVHVCMSIFILPFQDFYWAPVPMLDLITAIMFVIGVFLALRRTRNPRILLLNSWFWFGVFVIAIFTIPPSADPYRLLMVLPAICILAALGWGHVTSLAERLANANWRTVVIWSVILVVLVTGLNLKTYFIDFSRSCVYGGPNPDDRTASLLGEYLRAQPAFNQAYLLGDENFSYGNYPSLDYLSGSLPVINLPKPFTAPDAHGSTIFIFVPSREPERVAVSKFAPDGQTTRISDCGRLMFLAYRIYIP